LRSLGRLRVWSTEPWGAQPARLRLERQQVGDLRSGGVEAVEVLRPGPSLRWCEPAAARDLRLCEVRGCESGSGPNPDTGDLIVKLDERDGSRLVRMSPAGGPATPIAFSTGTCLPEAFAHDAERLARFTREARK
jgi:hypothetical protein